MGREVSALAARDATGLLSPYAFALRKTGPEDVVLKVLFCGMDHTDLHQLRNEIHDAVYPLVPGHEVVGQVVEVGSAVTMFSVGDLAGVGCIVGSCGSCHACASGQENYCSKRVFTYNGTDVDGRPTRGGFASAMTVNQRFAVRIPRGLAPEQVAPLLCAGVTAYNPLRLLSRGKGGRLSVGVLGLGGVGHLGVMMAKAMGHHVTVISSSERKRVQALVHLGADEYLVSGDEAAMAGASESLDCILDTVPAVHPLDKYLSLLKLQGKLVLVGVAPKPLQFHSAALVQGRKTISGSFIGSIRETEECLEFWAEKGLTMMIETVKMEHANKAFKRMEQNDVRYRFVMDVNGSSID